MKILLLTPQRPYPPHQGTTLRNFNLIKQLAQRHTICLLTFVEPDQISTDDDDTPLTDLCAWLETVPAPQRSLTKRVWQMMTTTRPDMGWRLWSPEFAQRLQAVLTRHRFDVVQLEAIEMAPYLPYIEQARPRPQIIYDAHNAETVLQKRACLTDLRQPRRWVAAAYSSVQWQRLHYYEADLLPRGDHTIAMSEPDAAALRLLSPNTPLTIVPNGVDWAAYAQYDGLTMPSDLLFTGKMDFRPNVDAMLWFGQQVLPLIQARRPQTTLTIVGQRPHKRLEPLRQQSGVTITGFVDSVLPYLAGATVYVAPLRVGGGTRLKLMEAMAMGKAIVSTTVGAEGFPVSDGREVRLADSPAAFAEAVLTLLADETERTRLGRAGQQMAQTAYDWATLIPRLEQVYNR